MKNRIESESHEDLRSKEDLLLLDLMALSLDLMLLSLDLILLSLDLVQLSLDLVLLSVEDLLLMLDRSISHNSISSLSSLSRLSDNIFSREVRRSVSRSVRVWCMGEGV